MSINYPQREECLKLLHENLKNQNLQKHCFAVEAIMAAMAERLGGDKNGWAVAGLLHDIDYEETKDDPEKHSLVGGEMLKTLGYSENIVKAVKAHNQMHGIAAETDMEKALVCADPMSGLIVAAALVLPSKKLADLKQESIVNRFGEKAFARGVRRDELIICEQLGLSLQDFSSLALKAMQGIAEELGL